MREGITVTVFTVFFDMGWPTREGGRGRREGGREGGRKSGVADKPLSFFEKERFT